MVEAIDDKGYDIDSFTTQPAKQILAKVARLETVLPIKELKSEHGIVYGLQCKICEQSVDITDDTWKWKAHHKCFQRSNQ